ncbi:hypothetical protein KCU65_g1968, partial [Aureobasidium melanogenum]
MEPSNGQPRLSLPGMPTEILSAVVSSIDSRSLRALRLTNKRLCAVSSRPFALLHFPERRHVTSAYSMDALVEITAHHFFGKFVKTVIISGSRPEVHQKDVVPTCQCASHNSLCKGPSSRHLALDFEQLRAKLEETFSNIKRNSPSVSIGFCDSAYECYGSVYYHADCAMISDTYRRMRLVKRPSKQPKSSGCKIDSIKLDTFSACMPYHSVTHHEREVLNMLHHLLGRLSGSLSFEVNLELTDARIPQYHLKYDRNTGELDLVGLILGLFTEPAQLVPDIEALLSRLSTRSVTQIKLRDCWFEKSDLPWMFGSQTLRKLTLCSVSFYTEHFDTNLWSSVLNQLARTTQLRHFEMSQCRYSFAEEENQDDDPFGMSSWFQLPSGVYELKNPLQWDSEFILAPSGDVNETIILTDQTNISGQLKALADQVAQLENDKIAEIERDGYVRTDIVGITKDFEPDENTASGEDDHGSMVDDGSDEISEEGGESAENND